MKNWIRIKDGEKITANYFGTEVTGTVESSRVKYGGKVQYTVNLDTPVQFRWRAGVSIDRVLIDHDEITNLTEGAV